MKPGNFPKYPSQNGFTRILPRSHSEVFSVLQLTCWRGASDVHFQFDDVKRRYSPARADRMHATGLGALLKSSLGTRAP
jgi:hypothetical protein